MIRDSRSQLADVNLKVAAKSGEHNPLKVGQIGAHIQQLVD